MLLALIKCVIYKSMMDFQRYLLHDEHKIIQNEGYVSCKDQC